MKKRLTATLCGTLCGPLCIILCGALLFSLSSCFLMKTLNGDPDKVYGKLLEEYAVLVQEKTDGEDVSAKSSPSTKGLSSKLFDSLKATVSESKYETAADMGYAFFDLNSDGVYECFLMKKDGTLYALYAMKNGTPYLVESYVTDHCIQGVLLEDGSIFTHRIIKKDGKTVASQYDYSFFTEGSMEAVRTYYVDYEADDAYAVEYGIKRDFADNEIHHVNDQATNMHNQYGYLSKLAGLRFCSATGDNSRPDAPAFDGSGYEGILGTVSYLMPHIQGFVYKDWLNGEYDNLLRVDSPEEFRLYNDLFYACGEHCGYSDVEGNRYTYEIGYAYKDLNSDGTDELFLLNENDSILAVFTLRKNTPVLLWRAGRYTAYTAMDAQGRLIVGEYANYNFTAMAYTAYELTATGEWLGVAYIYGDPHVRKIRLDGQIVFTDNDGYRAEYARIFKVVETDWNKGGKVLAFHKLG